MPLHDLTPQLRTRLRRVEKLVGLFVAVAGLLLLAGFSYYLYRTAERKGWFTPKCPYYTFVQSAAGLQAGDPVLLMGFSVGEITVVEAEPPASSYNVFIGFEVKRPYYGYIWSDSKARITAGGLLGGRQLEVTKGRAGVPTAYEKDGRVEEILVEGHRVALAGRPQGVALEPEEAPLLAERAERLVGQIEELLPRLSGRIESVLESTERLTTNLDGLVAQARPVVSNLDTITRNLRNPDGSLGEWLLPRQVRARLETTLAAVDGNLSVLSGTLGNFDVITGNLRTQVDSNRDLLGELSDLLRDTDDLIQGLERHWLLRSAFPPAKPGVWERPLAPLPGLPEQGTP